jgi:hypothetical protein
LQVCWQWNSPDVKWRFCAVFNQSRRGKFWMRNQMVKLLVRNNLLWLIAFCGVCLVANADRLGAAGYVHDGAKVASNHRFLAHADGTPFFYLGDTAWELFHRLSIEDSRRYLDDRAGKGFNVIQAAVLAELDGLSTPNADGDRPLIDNDPGRPNEAYFHHVDVVVDMARARGMFIGMLPTWGDKVTKAWGVGPVIFNPANAKQYGVFLGRRYRDRPNIIWILGGDRDATGFEAVWSAMAAGLREGDEGRHLITYHPSGDRSSSQWFQKEPWIDFNLMQSGHGRKDGANFAMIEKDYELTPVKPTIDGEPRYENHPVAWKPEQFGWFDDYDARQAAYWAVFAGAAGHTYGCNDIWQMKTEQREPMSLARGVWQEGLNLPGAGQMQYLRRLMESRPFFSRVPDQGLIPSDPPEGPDHMQGTRGDGYAFVYFPQGKPAVVATGRVSGRKLHAWWYNPRNGENTSLGIFKKVESKTFNPPGSPRRGNDWVLVLDDAGKRFGFPGQATKSRVE